MCSAVVYQLVCMGLRVSILSSCVISGDNTFLVDGAGVVSFRTEEQLPLRGRSLPSVISFSVWLSYSSRCLTRLLCPIASCLGACLVDVDGMLAEVTCDSFVDVSGGTRCPTWLVPVPGGDDIVCADGLCDDETCCEGEL